MFLLSPLSSRLLRPSAHSSSSSSYVRTFYLGSSSLSNRVMIRGLPLLKTDHTIVSDLEQNFGEVKSFKIIKASGLYVLYFCIYQN